MIIPIGWVLIDKFGEGYALAEKNGGLRVIFDEEIKSDGKLWRHVSYSRKDWTPDHVDTIKIKAAFIGDRYAYAVFPPKSQYVNIHPYCLHLWSCMEGDGRILPEFSGEIEGIGKSI